MRHWARLPAVNQRPGCGVRHHMLRSSPPSLKPQTGPMRSAIRSFSQVRKVAANVHAMIVPGSGLVKEQAEQEGLDRIFVEAGFDWREPGCSMCLAMNADRLEPGERCASTSNRNFEGRHGRGGRTHLVSPGMAAAAVIAGKLADVRDL